MMRVLISIFLLSAIFLNAGAKDQQGPRVLVVMAHPDDESVFSVTLYKIVKEQHGSVDIFVITNGEAGYKYSTLAESYYGVKLTDEKTGRKDLPEIRKKELKNAGHILGVSHYYFGDQTDTHYGLDEKEPLDTSWNVPSVKRKLNRVLKNNYDLVLCLLPEVSTHGQHKAASLLALNAVAGLEPAKRPIILGARTRNKTDTLFNFSEYKDLAETQTIGSAPSWFIDRTTSFSYHDRVNYKVIANWELAEHKSQGATQMTMNDGDLEEFWYFKINVTERLQKCATLFQRLKQVPYLAKNY